MSLRTTILLLVLLITPPVVGQNVSDAAVAARIKVLQNRLLRMQRPDGSWDYAGYPVGATALAVLALRTSGVPPNHVSVRGGVKYICENADHKVYSEGLVPCALEGLDHDAACLDRVRRAVAFLVRSQSQDGTWFYFVPVDGAEAERVLRVSGDNSNTQFAILGLGAAERCGVAVPEETKRRAVSHWQATQNSDGGWGYRVGNGSRLSMTCAGIASLHLLEVELETHGQVCGKYALNSRMSKALSFLSRQLRRGPQSLSADGQQPYYTLYALERVGMLLELKSIGKLDWYSAGAKFICGRAPAGRVADDAFALLFLAKGAAPIAIAKWQWRGDWNNDHRDVKNWVAEAGREFNRKLDWLPAKLGSLASPAAKASMIFVNGHDAFKASDKELEFIRAFLAAGGTVVGEACCASTVFADSFRKAMRSRLFPELGLSFVPVGVDHPVCNAVHELDPGQVRALQLKRGCRRQRVLLLTRDISCALNGEATAPAEATRARQVAVNILAWALSARQADKKLDRPELERADLASGELTVDQLLRARAKSGRHFHQPLGRLKHRGDWLTDARFFTHYDAMVASRTDLPRFDGEIHVNPNSEDLFQCAVVFMTGHEAPELTEAERLNVRTYLQNGGFLFASACCSSPEFDKGMRKLVRQLLPNDQLEEIPADDPTWTVPFACRDRRVMGTRAYYKHRGTGWGPLLGVRRQGRWVLVYSPVDLCCALEGDLADEVQAYGKPEAFCLVSNILWYALTP